MSRLPPTVSAPLSSTFAKLRVVARGLALGVGDVVAEPQRPLRQVIRRPLGAADLQIKDGPQVPWRHVSAGDVDKVLRFGFRRVREDVGAGEVIRRREHPGRLGFSDVLEELRIIVEALPAVDRSHEPAAHRPDERERPPPSPHRVPIDVELVLGDVDPLVPRRPRGRRVRLRRQPSLSQIDSRQPLANAVLR